MLEIDPQLLQEAFVELFANAGTHGRAEGPLVFEVRAEGEAIEFDLREPKTQFNGATGKLGARPLATCAERSLWSWPLPRAQYFRGASWSLPGHNLIQPPRSSHTTVSLPAAAVVTSPLRAKVLPPRSRESRALSDDRREPTHPDHRRRASDPDDARGIVRPARLSPGSGGECLHRNAFAREQIARARPARPATARRRRPAHARANQGRASGDAGDHPDRARFVEQRDRVDQTRRLSFHQQTVRAGRAAQPGREGARKTIAPARNDRAARDHAAVEETARAGGDAARADFQEQGDAANRRA